MKLPGTNKARALEVDFAPMPLAGAVERRKWSGDRADGRKENAGSPASFRKPAGSSTTSTLNFLRSALYSWPVARNSGRHDLNVRPPAPKAGALAKLSYAPCDVVAGCCCNQPHQPANYSVRRRWMPDLPPTLSDRFFVPRFGEFLPFGDSCRCGSHGFVAVVPGAASGRVTFPLFRGKMRPASYSQEGSG